MAIAPGGATRLIRSIRLICLIGPKSPIGPISPISPISSIIPISPTEFSTKLSTLTPTQIMNFPTIPGAEPLSPLELNSIHFATACTVLTPALLAKKRGEGAVKSEQTPVNK